MSCLLLFTSTRMGSSVWITAIFTSTHEQVLARSFWTAIFHGVGYHGSEGYLLTVTMVVLLVRSEFCYIEHLCRPVTMVAPMSPLSNLQMSHTVK